jgi:hypothetical protein
VKEPWAAGGLLGRFAAVAGTTSADSSAMEITVWQPVANCIA